ncbi:hypothetical protein MCOR25_006839 [Pyricularia grisea]|uniref:Sugar phosphate transporter domain-containing protein n=1 Tax=Pyricularia grisea TaxID=148305 RepID=A0A6P8AS13_PYRGI|nr:uncharacterized protein PgNI_09727 [Pyricularia grisea]KAI6360132.1 hypothetical protein MCOR25_006839 [Pyricularia grisea]TLD04910.1 hypothetical protein PgNI_09727 [Pyricularia grisea]
MEKFPDLDVGITNHNANKFNGHANGNTNGGAYPPPAGVRWTPASSTYSGSGRSGGHSRQKSISEAIRTIRSRHGSVGQNAHEIADALKAPLSPRLIVLCIIWYGSSALTNTSSKSILNAFAMPATLTLVQFAFVCGYCLLLSWLASIFPGLRTAVPALKHGIRYPSRDVIQTTMPLAAFQIFGHLLSSTATSKIPVSLVHTIKGLSPLFTVLAYRIVFNIRYPAATYLSLVPLTLGVMLACSGKHKFGGEVVGIVYALIATLIFVTQNIFSKRLFNEAARAEAEGMGHKSRKLDKLNLLCYSSGMAFILTVPIWFWSEGIGIIKDFLRDGSIDLAKAPGSFDHGRLFIEFVFNGTFHFGQNIMAFVLLSMVSPVTYSVASLIKRVFVIVIALVWFRSPTTKIQAVGIALTFVGLYLYDRTKEGNRADKRATYLGDKGAKDSILPLSTKTNGVNGGLVFESPASAGPNGFNGGINAPRPYVNGYALPARTDGDNKKSDDQTAVGTGRQRGASTTSWMPPGTRQEDTWRVGDRNSGGPVR